MRTTVLTLALAALDLVIVYLLVRRIPPSRFRELKWPLVVAAGIFWAAFATILVWSYWDSYYRYFAFEINRWIEPVAGLLYAAIALLFWWLARRLPGSPALTFLILGGLESVPEHLLGIFWFRILEIPALQGETALSIVFFAFFEYILYWGVVLALALLVQNLARRWSARLRQEVT